MEVKREARDARDAVRDAMIDAMEVKREARDARDAVRDAMIDTKFDYVFGALSASSDMPIQTICVCAWLLVVLSTN